MRTATRASSPTAFDQESRIALRLNPSLLLVNGESAKKREMTARTVLAPQFDAEFWRSDTIARHEPQVAPDIFTRQSCGGSAK
jgi:hypothetical protein